jgi:hypothetical protein
MGHDEREKERGGVFVIFDRRSNEVNIFKKEELASYSEVAKLSKWCANVQMAVK